MKGMNIPFEKIPGYKHGGNQNKVFMTLQRVNMP